MERKEWDRLLELAIETQRLGEADFLLLLQSREAPAAAPGTEGWDERVAWLVGRGILTKTAVEDLMAELRARELEHGRTLPFPLSFLTRLRRGDSVPFQFGHFRVEAFLSEGGMGEVYRAQDTRLGRPVAVKFLRGDQPEMLERFAQEARTQARVDHPNVCKVYEVGEASGMPYIVMPLLRGRSLDRAAPDLTFGEKARVMRDVADAVHAAHRAGLIHRDLKPANIMLDRTEEAGWTPTVMDFGLARELTASRLTLSGAVMGTPSYMAPEQARGKVRDLDKRTDIYALGATLYELLAGRPPFEAVNIPDLLVQIVEREPVPPRKLIPAVPRDLETIALKCLEKEPGKRYDSARALADDLQRFLDGEPLRARRTSPAERLVRKARKHKALTAAAAAALCLVLGAAGVAVHIRRQAAAQAALAGRYGQRAEAMESLLRQAHMMPLHDVNRETALVKDRIAELEREVKGSGAIGEGPGRLALGRGWMALQDYGRAREELERAWASGYRPPELSYALGLTLARQYKLTMDELSRTSSKAVQEARRKAVDASLRDPALGYLKGAAAAGLESPEYAQGLVCYLERRYDDALRQFDLAARRAPWLYEAPQLEGDLRVAQGKERAMEGDYDGALGAYERAGKAYARALDMGRSDPGLLTAEAYRWVHTMEALLRKGDPSEEACRRGLAAARQALVADPGNARAQNVVSRLLWRRADDLLAGGREAGAVIAQAVEAARAAVRSDPGDPIGYANLGTSLWTRGAVEEEAGKDPRPTYAESVEAYRKEIRIHPDDFTGYLSSGGVRQALANWELGHGVDPGPTLDRAIADLSEALRLFPGNASAHNNLGTVRFTKAEQEQARGRNPDGSLAQAVESFSKAIELNPKNAYACNNLAEALRLQAGRAWGRGGDGTAELERAEAVLQKALEVNPKFHYAYLNLGKLHEARAERAAGRGEDPLPELDRAVELFRRSLELKPTYLSAHLGLGRAFQMRGTALLEHGKDPSRAIAAGLAATEEAERVDPGRSEVHLNRAELLILEGRRLARAGRSPEETWRKAAASLGAARNANERSAGVAMARLRLEVWRAAWLRSAGKPVGPAVDEGLRAAVEVQPEDPAAAERSALEGLLHLEAARGQRDPSKARSAAGEAFLALTRALDANLNLRHRYGQALEEARKFSVN